MTSSARIPRSSCILRSRRATQPNCSSTSPRTPICSWSALAATAGSPGCSWGRYPSTSRLMPGARSSWSADRAKTDIPSRSRTSLGAETSWDSAAFLENCDKKKADERARTADLLSLRVIIQALQRFAHSCKCRINKELSVLRVAACCTVLRSRWCQSGVNGTLVLVLRPFSQGTQGPYRHARHSPSLHHRMHLQPAVEAPRMRPVSEGSLYGVVAIYVLEEIVRGVIGFGLARVMNLEPPYLE